MMANTSFPVNNDFHNTSNLFDLVKDLDVRELDTEIPVENGEPKAHTNGATNGTTNGATDGAAPELAVKN